MTTKTDIATPALEKLNPQDALDMALIIGEVFYIKRARGTYEDLIALAQPWLNLPVDYVNPTWIYGVLDEGATIRENTGYTDAELIQQIKTALAQFIDMIYALKHGGQ